MVPQVGGSDEEDQVLTNVICLVFSPTDFCLIKSQITINPGESPWITMMFMIEWIFMNHHKSRVWKSTNQIIALPVSRSVCPMHSPGATLAFALRATTAWCAFGIPRCHGGCHQEAVKVGGLLFQESMYISSITNQPLAESKKQIWWKPHPLPGSRRAKLWLQHRLQNQGLSLSGKFFPHQER